MSFAWVVAPGATSAAWSTSGGIGRGHLEALVENPDLRTEEITGRGPLNR